MTKGFMEVFPELVLEQEVRALFEKVKVERVTTTRQKDLIRVYISCGRLIPKTVIFRVEEEQGSCFRTAISRSKFRKNFSCPPSTT